MADNSLIQINKPGNMTRRSFLKVLGATGAAAATGCADSSEQNVFPNVKGDAYQVPGVATWYNTTCTECSAGCGISVRNREGRAVKIEGNCDNPVASGGLCGLGQASLQGLYNPDRIRQPLEKVREGDKDVFKPLSWKKAYKKVSSALKKSSGKVGVFTGDVSGSMDKLLDSFRSAFDGKRVSYELLDARVTAEATKLVYGDYGIPKYNIEHADVVLNFGADFLETWISPCEFARGWAKSRTGDSPMRFVHIEPRLSLTGANADTWHCNKPGTELQIALAVLKLLADWNIGDNVSGSVRSKIKKLTKNVDVAAAAKDSGIPEEKLLLTARYLTEAKSSLVLSGGAAGLGGDALSLAVVTALMNLLLSNVGKTIDISAMRRPKSSVDEVESFLDDLRSGDLDLLFISGANPAFTLPSDYGFEYAVREARAHKARADKGDQPLLVSFASQLDETAELADIILPAHHFLEDWGDVHPMPGVYSVVQPTMTPVFDTRSLGDMLLGVSSDAGKDIGPDTYADYVKDNWRDLYKKVSPGTSFYEWWNGCLDRGGYFAPKSTRVRVKVSDKAFALAFGEESKPTKGTKPGALHLLPYPSVKGFDGRAANKPWLQELPDPITKVVWDSWAELHPETAKKHGIAAGDTVNVRNFYGEISVPAYITEHVHKDVVAVPIGQGHTSYGRYAKEVSAVGNVIELLPSTARAAGAVALSAATVNVERGIRSTKLVTTQQFDSQEGRHLAQTDYVAPKKHSSHVNGHDSHGHGDDHHGDSHHGDSHHGGHHEPKQMYEQREHPLYQWAMSVDLAACTGCGSCVVACNAENNVPVVGKEVVDQGREMSWLRIERYYDAVKDEETGAQELKVSFLPMMCQHCQNAPCEPVCPVYATYHNEEGLNAMIYNRCVGTRYCSNNCSYKVRRFNWFEFEFPEPLQMQLNPDVTKRTAGVMEKCNFCVQRIQEGKDTAKDDGRLVEDGDIQPACVQSCATGALVFGNIKDKDSKVYKAFKSGRAYKVLDHHLNTQPSVAYQKDVRVKA